MIIFKTTFHFEEEIQEKALEYIKNVYVKQALDGDVLYRPQLSQILVNYEEVGSSYVLQFRVKSREELDKWLANEGGALQEDLYQEFGEKICSFVALKKRIELEL